MSIIALVGPELEENLSLRYLASSLTAAGFHSTIVPFNRPDDLPRVVAELLESGEQPALVGLSLAFQRRAKDFLALAVALRQRGYTGHISAGGHFGTFACREILRDFAEVDSICRHEAEHTLVSLATGVFAGTDLASIRGLAYRDAHGNTRLTDLPAPPDLERLRGPTAAARLPNASATAWLRWWAAAAAMVTALLLHFSVARGDHAGQAIPSPARGGRGRRNVAASSRAGHRSLRLP